MLVMTPLLGLAFHSDQRISMYQFASQFRANPLRIIRENISEIPEFLQKGNFRPVGRFIFYLEDSARYEIATATGIPPHVIQGVIRVILVGLLVWVATCVVTALHRSSLYRTQSHGEGDQAVVQQRGYPEERRSPLALAEAFPLLFASTLIVTGPLHPISFFPFFLISMTIVILIVPLYLSSDKAMYQNRVSKGEAAMVSAIGLLTAMTYELMYVLPVVCVVMVLLRGRLAGLTYRTIFGSAAFSRFIIFCISFALIFIPSRVMIAMECSRNDCYGNSELSISGLVLEQWLGRMFSGLPLHEWLSVLRNDTSADIGPKGFLQIGGNLWLILVVVALGIFAIRVSRRLSNKAGYVLPVRKHRQVAAASIVLGVTLIVLSTLMVSLSQGLQVWQSRGLGLNQWRDTLLVQVGWVFLLYGVGVLLFSLLHRYACTNDKPIPWLSYVSVVTLTVAFSAMMVLTLVANDHYAAVQRSKPITNTVNLISTASIEFDSSESGMALRCELLADYAGSVCDSCWHSGIRLQEQLNDLSRSRYGSDFCPIPVENP